MTARARLGINHAAIVLQRRGAVKERVTNRKRVIGGYASGGGWPGCAGL